MIASCIIGIDPGISGAIAFYFPVAPDRVSVEDVPTVDGQIDAATLAKRIAQMAPAMAIVEAVHAMPKQGVSSSFNFEKSFGVVIGVVAAVEIPIHLVTPGKWKRHFGLSADKETSRARALQMFPATSEHFARKRDHGRAEAALLALYGAQFHQFPEAATLREKRPPWQQPGQSINGRLAELEP